MAHNRREGEEVMHIYRKTKDGDGWMYTVGYFIPESGDDLSLPQWVALEDTSDESEARALVNYLNGGQGYLFRYTK